MNKHQLHAVYIVNKILELLSFSSGDTEKKIADRIEAFLKGFGAKPAFRIIVASGKRACVPHAYPTKKVVRQGEMLKIDFGALYKGWRSDVTRTYHIGKPSEKFKHIYNVVKQAQLKAIKVVKPGVKCCRIDEAARNYIKQHGFGKNFIHTTGHGIGRKTHEQPKISLKNRNKLKAGQVITIEPGIYIKGWGGVRIEDMVLVTRKGAKLLTQSAKVKTQK